MAKLVKKIVFDKSKVKPFSPKDFKSKKTLYPNNSIKPADKGKAYHLQMAEKIYGLILNKKTWMPSTVFSKIDEYRAWSDGEQDVSEMLDWILGKSEAAKAENINKDGWDVRDDVGTESKRKAWANIDTSPVSIFPKIKTKINESIRSMYYEMSVNSIDSYSLQAEEKKKNNLWLYKQNKEWMERQYKMAGAEKQEPDFMPENYEELELYAMTGGFKMPYTIAVEDLVRHTFTVSGWDKDVAEKVRDDLMTLRHAMVKEEFDREQKRVIVKYSNPKHSGLQYGKRGNKDSEFGYEIEWVELSKIRQRLNLSYEEAAMLGFSYSGMYGNPESSDWDKNSGIHADDSGNEYMGCDFYKVPELLFDFIDIDNENYIQFNDKFGKTRTKKYNDKLQENEELKSEQYRYVRTARWIIGSEHIYDWGRQEYMPRDEFERPRIRFRGIKLNTISLLQQVLPFMKGFQLAWMKAQNAIALAVGNGFAVDIGSIKGIAIGKGNNWDPMEVLSFYRQTTFMLYRQNKSLSGLSRYSAPPIVPIQNSSYENIKVQFEAMNFFIQKIEDSSGISMVSTGKTPDPDVAKFNMQVSLQGTNDIINNITRAQTDLQEDVSTNIIYKIRSYCRVNPNVRKSYENVIGKVRMATVMAAEKNHVSYGISIEASDITEEKRNIFAMIQQAITPTGSGDQAKLSVSEGMLVLDMVHQRQNMRRIGLIVGHWTRRKEKEMAAKQMQMVQAQGQQLQQNKMIEAQQKEQDRQATEKQDYNKFRSDFIIKYGQTPEEYMSNNKNL